MQPEIVAALIGAGTLVIVTLAPPLFNALKRRSPEIFPVRDVSDDAWFRDMKRAEHLVFFGTSHVRLDAYLFRYMRSVEGVSPLCSIEIYYTSQRTGMAREGKQFTINVRNSRQRIAACICGQEWSTKFIGFDQVQFRQFEGVTSFSGTIIVCANKKYIVYVVQHPIEGPFEAEEQVTLRYTSSFLPLIGFKKQKILKKYLSAYKRSRSNSRSLGVFRCSLWDKSVKEWSKFSRECTAHRSSMRTLVSLAKLNHGEKVLDLASGCGQLSQLILEKNPNVALTLLDSSPNMLAAASGIAGEQVDYALCKLPCSLEDCNVDTTRKFDVILMHLSLPSVAANREEILKLAIWCKNHISEDGRVLICAHNTALTENSEYSVDHDPLRRSIEKHLVAQGLKDICRRLEQPKLEKNNIVRAFASNGLACIKNKKYSFPMKMSHRILMWQAPVVLQDIVEVEGLARGQLEELFSKVTEEIDDMKTPDMIVTYWEFKKVEVTDRASNDEERRHHTLLSE